MKTRILIATHCTSSSGGRGRMRTISKSKRSLMIRNFTPSPSITREHGCSASPTKSLVNTHAVKTTSTRIILGLGRDLFVPTARGDLSSRRRLRAGAGETSHKMRKILPLRGPRGRGNALRFVHTFKAPGWSVRPKRFAGLLLRLRPIGLALRATPSAPSLRSAQPPLLCEEGNGHGGRARSIWPVESSSDDQNDA